METGHVDYEEHGRGYAMRRKADPHIASQVLGALGDAATVVNVGAGAGSYEPTDRWVLAVEPSAVMRAQRPEGAAPVIAAHAEALPLDDDSVDAAMASLTIHHWTDRARGLSELRRVARGRVVILTFDLEAITEWQQEFLGAAIYAERPRFGRPEEIERELGGSTRVVSVETPADCTDGFIQAFWARPEALLDPRVRGAQSVWTLLGPGVEDRMVERLKASLDSGDWDERFGGLRHERFNDGGIRLIISDA